MRNSNGRLPPENRSHSRETWGKPVSDDSAHFVFEADFFGVAVPRPDLITIPRSSLPDLSSGDDPRQLARASLTLSPSMNNTICSHFGSS